MLLSDRLDAPYSKLNLSKTKVSFFLDKLIAKIWDYENKIIVVGNFPAIEILIDAVKIELAIKNLIDNAIKHSNADKPIEISSSINNDTLFIIVQDFGCGIDVAFINKIMEPFFRTKNNNSGMGLGLSIAKKIITAHNCNLTVEIKINRGSKFSLSLPLK